MIETIESKKKNSKKDPLINITNLNQRIKLITKSTIGISIDTIAGIIETINNRSKSRYNEVLIEDDKEYTHHCSINRELLLRILPEKTQLKYLKYIKVP